MSSFVQLEIDVNNPVELPKEIRVNPEEIGETYGSINYDWMRGNINIQNRREERTVPFASIPLEHLLYIIEYFKKYLFKNV